MAFYALIMGIVYIAGLPIAVFILLWSRRHKLFGDPGRVDVEVTRTTYGFLYQVVPGGCQFDGLSMLVSRRLLPVTEALGLIGRDCRRMVRQRGGGRWRSYFES